MIEMVKSEVPWLLEQIDWIRYAIGQLRDAEFSNCQESRMLALLGDDGRIIRKLV